MHQRRRRLALTAAALLATVPAGCGFALRQATVLAFESIYVGASSASPMGSEIRRSVATLDHVQLITDASRQQEAQVILELLAEQREKVVAGLNSAGQVREFQLRIRVRFRLRTPGGKELIPDTELLQQREISFNESAVLAKEAEEANLYRDMQSDIAQQLMRRIAAVKIL